jgi:hypothetical protein
VTGKEMVKFAHTWEKRGERMPIAREVPKREMKSNENVK